MAQINVVLRCVVLKKTFLKGSGTTSYTDRLFGGVRTGSMVCRGNLLMMYFASDLWFLPDILLLLCAHKVITKKRNLIPQNKVKKTH